MLDIPPGINTTLLSLWNIIQFELLACCNRVGVAIDVMVMYVFSLTSIYLRKFSLVDDRLGVKVFSRAQPHLPCLSHRGR